MIKKFIQIKTAELISVLLVLFMLLYRLFLKVVFSLLVVALAFVMIFAYLVSAGKINFLGNYQKYRSKKEKDK